MTGRKGRAVKGGLEFTGYRRSGGTIVTVHRAGARAGLRAAKHILMLSVLLIALAPIPIPSLEAAPQDRMTVTDMEGRHVEVPRAPHRIVCLGPGTLRQICYLRAADRVVGVERMEKAWPVGRPYWLAHPELSRLPSVAPGGAAGINAEPDLERVLEVDPQVIFISYMEPAKADALEKKIGIPVVVLTTGRFATFDQAAFDSLRTAGKVLDREQRAEAIISYIDEARKDLRARTAAVPSERQPLVYVGALGYKGLQGIESTDADYMPFEWLPVRNLARRIHKDGHLFLDREELLRRDPDVIFLDGGGAALVAADYLRKRTFYDSLKAFRTKRVYILFPYNWYVTNIETAIADAYAAGKILYPECFSDVSPEKKAREVMAFFVGRPDVYDRMERAYGRLGHVADFPASP